MITAVLHIVLFLGAIVAAFWLGWYQRASRAAAKLDLEALAQFIASAVADARNVGYLGWEESSHSLREATRKVAKVAAQWFEAQQAGNPS